MSSKKRSDKTGPDDGVRGETSVTAGYFWSFGATALPLVSIFISSLIIARLMGPAVVGLVSLTMALATVLLIVAKFGVDGAASRLASEFQVSAPHLLPRLVRSSVLLRLAFTVPTAIIAVVLAPSFSRLFDQEELLPLFRLGGLLIIAVSVNELAALLVLGLGRFRLLFSMRVAMLILRVTLVVLAAIFAQEAQGVIGAYIITSLLPGLLVLAILFRLRTGGNGSEGEPVLRRLLLLSIPLAVSGASVTVYSLLDKLMLGYYEEPSQVGLYTVARNIVETSLFPTFALVMTLRPAIAGAYASGDLARCSYLVNRSLRNTFTYAFCVVVTFACLARPFVTGLFTDSFAVSAELLVLFLPLVVMRSLGTVILPGLIAADRAGTYARLTLIGAAMNFILNVLFIPVWKAKGAVAATLISYLPVEVCGLWAVGRSFPAIWSRSDTWRVLKTTAAGVAVFVAYRRVMPEPSTFILMIVHGIAIAAVFGGFLIVLRAVTAAELRDYFRAFMKKGTGR
jgi:O-antigen/teichoic acid export membrane protein